MRRARRSAALTSGARNRRRSADAADSRPIVRGATRCRARRDRGRQLGSSTPTMPSGPSRTGSAAVLVRFPAESSGATKQLTSCASRRDARRSPLPRRRPARTGPAATVRDTRGEPSARRLVEHRVAAKPPMVASSHGITVWRGGSPSTVSATSLRRAIGFERDKRADRGRQRFGRRPDDPVRARCRAHGTPRSTSSMLRRAGADDDAAAAELSDTTQQHQAVLALPFSGRRTGPRRR